ncbi:MAG TPA: cell wall hydrolase [Lachnospiraceae bacterium]|nr:cell wall hydrolase [Lachnospiraceae bacterium]
MWKKGMAALLLAMTWLCLSGFAGLGNEGEDTLNALLDQLTSEDVEVILTEDEWEGKAIAKVDDSVSVRAAADPDAMVIGKMFKGDGGQIVEQEEDWTMIQSGNVTGWINNEYLAFGVEAKERAEEDVAKVATVTTQTLKVRQEPNTDAPVIDLIGMGEQIEVGAEEDGWLEIVYSDGAINYISSEYVDVEYDYGEAKTMDEIEAEEKARREEEEEAKRTANLGAIAASGDELTLLAALIQAEADNQPYEGQVAVGAVVMNRVRSSAYPGTIPDVISAPGQFGPVATGRVAAIMASGPRAVCYQAAQAALDGETTVGTLTHFRRDNGSISGIVIGNHVFY